MLKPKKNIKRKELQEDNLVTSYVKVQNFIKKYSQQVQIGIIVIIVIVGVSIFMLRSKRAAGLKAAGLLGVAEQYAYAQQYERSIQEYLTIIDTYPGTKSAGRATFFLANIYFTQEDYSNATLYFEEFTKKYTSDKLFMPSAIAGLAACHEQQDRFGEAADLFMKAAEKYPEYFQVTTYYMNAARCRALAGEKDKARDIYAHVIEAFEDSQESKEAEMFVHTL